MIKFNPNERPSINDILNCDWMKGDCANNLEVLSDFAAREITVKQQLELEKIANQNVSYDNKVLIQNITPRANWMLPFLR